MVLATKKVSYPQVAEGPLPNELLQVTNTSTKALWYCSHQYVAETVDLRYFFHSGWSS